MAVHDTSRGGVETRPIRMRPVWLIMLQAPNEDIDRIFAATMQLAPLAQSKIDRNGYRAPGSLEYCRLREGTRTRAEEDAS